MTHLSDSTRHLFDLVSVGALVGWIVGALPTFTLIVTAGWATVKLATVILEYRIKQQEYALNARKLRDD